MSLQVTGLRRIGGRDWLVSILGPKGDEATGQHRDLESAVVIAAARLDIRTPVTASSALAAVQAFLEASSHDVRELERDLARRPAAVGMRR